MCSAALPPHFERKLDLLLFKMNLGFKLAAIYNSSTL